jgi:pimeloyl-ACP methyl ester carboxylesterase
VSTTVLPGGGHAPHRQAPAEIGAAVAAFLRDP